MTNTAEATKKKADNFVAMAMSDEVLKRGLRTNNANITKIPYRSSPTIPDAAPHFSTLHARDLPKSTAQQDEELMAGFQRSRFQAKPILRAHDFGFRENDADQNTKNKPTVTEPVPFHFHETKQKSSPTSEELAARECRSQFHARPAPDFTSLHNANQHHQRSSPQSSKKVTQVQPFVFASDARRSNISVNSSHSSELSLSVTSSRKGTTVTPRNKSIDTPKVKTTPPSPTIPQPFHLATDERGAKYQQQFQQQVLALEAARRQQAEQEASETVPFKALTFDASIDAATAQQLAKQAEREQQKVQQRHQQEQQRRAQQKEQAAFKAKPLPKYYSSPTKTSSPPQASTTTSSPEHDNPIGANSEQHRRSPLLDAIFGSSASSQSHPDLAPPTLTTTPKSRDTKLPTSVSSSPAFKARALPKWYRQRPTLIGKGVPNVTHGGSAAQSRGKAAAVTSSDVASPVPSTKKTLNGSDTAKTRARVAVSRARDPSHHRTFASGFNNTPAAALSWRAVLGIVLFRVANVALIRTAFDPDEYWQMLEPAYCEVFAPDATRCAGYTWEWNKSPRHDVMPPDLQDLGAARSYVSILPVYGYYQLLQYWQWDTSWAVARGPMVLHALLVAAPTDVLVHNIARWLPPTQDHGSDDGAAVAAWCLFASLSSWFHGYTLVRTFSNCQESLLIVLGLWLVAPELLQGTQIHSSSRSLLRHVLAFLLGGLCVAIRPSSVFAFATMGVMVACNCRSVARALVYLLFPCALCGVTGIAGSMVVDRAFHGTWVLPAAENLRFNVAHDLARKYGEHPGYWYFTAGMPALLGLLYPIFLWETFALINKLRVSAARARLWIIMMVYVSALSVNPHKEFRYALPIVPIACVICGHRLNRLSTACARRGISLAALFVILNLIAVAYLGLVHQRGPVAVNQDIVKDIVSLSQSLTASMPNSSQMVEHPRNISVVSVHYLTGSCHSTPLYSHLHLPRAASTQVVAYALDCSPRCRVAVDRQCETDTFRHNPVEFVRRLYYTQNGECNVSYSATGDKSSSNECFEADGMSFSNASPDYVVTTSDYVETLRSSLNYLGLWEVQRFLHTVNGVKLTESLIVGRPAFVNKAYKHYMILDTIEFSADEMILFAKRKPWGTRDPSSNHKKTRSALH